MCEQVSIQYDHTEILDSFDSSPDTVLDIYLHLKETFDEYIGNCVSVKDTISMREDELATCLVPDDVIVPLPDGFKLKGINTTGNGDCLFNTVSLALSGTENLAYLLRILTACELFLHADYYSDHPRLHEASENPSMSIDHPDTLFSLLLSDEGDNHFCQTRDKIATVRFEGKLTCERGRWSSLLHVFVLASVIQMNIFAVYPDCNHGIRPLFHGKIVPRSANSTLDLPENTIYVLWSRDGNLDNTPNFAYQPNHFVYLQQWTESFGECCHEVEKRLSDSQNDPFIRKKIKKNEDHVNKDLNEDEEALFSNHTEPNSATDKTISFTTNIGMNNLPSSNADFGILRPHLVSGRQPIDDDTKYSLIIKRIPPKQFMFPSKEYKDKNKKSGTRTRSCQHQWFDQFNFITYSVEEDGIYCLACILFPIKDSPGGRAKFLITSPYRNWKDAMSDLKSHAVCDYHRASAEQMELFLKVMEKEELGIDFILDRKKKERVEKNRGILRSILKCIEYCGRQGIALRGHRDDDKIKLTDFKEKGCDMQIENQGNFKNLLKLCSDLGDQRLKEHLETCASNATYTSKESQNELLTCIKKYIQAEIVSKIQNQPHGPLFGVQADESTDVSGKEQLGIVLRYLEDGKKPIEKLIEFVECEEITGEKIAESIVEKVNSLGLHMQNCRSQCYDGAANMSGIRKGCATRISELYPRAKYYYCLNHDLNLAVSKSCQIPEMQVMMECTKQLGIFFKYSCKRQVCLEKSLDTVNDTRRQAKEDTIKKYKLKILCETRWIERHTTLEHLHHIYEAVIHCLNTISTRSTGTWDAKSVTEATGLLTQISSTCWIVALCVNLHFSGYLKSLSTLLQGPTQDILTNSLSKNQFSFCRIERN